MKELLSSSITEQWGSVWDMEGSLLFHDDIDDKSIVNSSIDDLLSMSYTLRIDLTLTVDKYRDIDRENEQEKIKVFLENASQLGARDIGGFHFSANYYNIDKFKLLDLASSSDISPYDAIYINKNSTTSAESHLNFTMIHRDSSDIVEEEKALAYWMYEVENVDGIGIILNWYQDIPTSVEIESESELNNFKQVVGNNTVLVSPRRLQGSTYRGELVVLDLDLYGVTLDEIKVYEFYSPHADFGIDDITDELEHIEGNKYFLAYIDSIAVVKGK